MCTLAPQRVRSLGTISLRLAQVFRQGATGLHAWEHSGVGRKAFLSGGKDFSHEVQHAWPRKDEFGQDIAFNLHVA
jgi:hypothetical protein